MTWRSLCIVGLFAACGGSAQPPATVANTSKQSRPTSASVAIAEAPPAETAAPPAEDPEPAQPPTDDPEPDEPECDANLDLPNGLHDRYLFRDSATEKVGFKNKRGRIVIPAVFEDGYPFTRGGVAAMTNVSGFVFIDTRGTVIAKAYAFDNGPDYYQDGFARVVGTDGRIGYIGESSGKIEIPPQFDAAFPFCGGKATVERDGQKFVIDRTGARVQ